MHQEILIAGSGGQGIMIIGQLLTCAALAEGKNVVWFPSYGPEARGGTADCTVIISSEEIGSPITDTPDTLLALNQVMLDRLAKTVKREGILVVNTSLATPPTDRDDWHLLKVAASDVANELGNMRIANMVILGAYVQFARPVKLDSVKQALTEVLPKHRQDLLPLNLEALDKGAELVNTPMAF